MNEIGARSDGEGGDAVAHRPGSIIPQFAAIVNPRGEDLSNPHPALVLGAPVARTEQSECIRQLLHMFNQVAPIARSFGMVLSFDEQGQATVTLPYNPSLDHGL